MTTVQLMQLCAPQQYESSIDDIVQEATTVLQNASSVQEFIVGTELEDKNSLQVMTHESEPADSTITMELLNSLHKFSIAPSTNLHLSFNNQSSALSSLTTAPIIEYAQSWFPLADATPAFKQQIEQDFDKFTEIFKRESQGDVAGGYGWVEEELEREEVKGGKSTSFVVVRAWETFEDFKMSTSTESFREAAPILYSWGAPYRMWFVERKAAS